MKKLLTLALFMLLSAGAAQAEDLEVFIVSGDMVKVMARTPAASGEQFKAAGDDGTFFGSDAEEAYLTVEGREVVRYVLLRPFMDRAPDELFLTVDGKNYRLKRLPPSSSGVTYEAIDAPSETVLWREGDFVILIVEGTMYPGYDTWQPLGRIWLPKR